MMKKKLASFIVDCRFIILAVMLVLAIGSIFLMQKVEVNEDMTKYLPDDSAMKVGMDIMTEEFPEMDTSQTIRVMFDDLTAEGKELVLEALQNIEYVDSVSYDADSADYNKENHTLFVINSKYEYDSEEMAVIEKALDSDFSEYTMTWNNDDTGIPHIPTWILVAAVGILMTILFVMCGSWIEPILFLVGIGFAVLINQGTNIFMGSLSGITSSISSILQLILSMDYSIILINRYKQEKERFNDNKDAMKAAVENAFSSIVSSGMTTVIGLLMLVFMSFKIGMDLGVVLAKGVFLSMICVLMLMPGIIISCDKLIQKTAKKELHIPMNWAGKFSHKMRYVISGVFVVLMVVAYILQQQTGIVYTLQKEDEVAEVFRADNTLVLVYDTKDENVVSDITKWLKDDANVKSVMSYNTMFATPYTAEELSEEISQLSDEVQLDKNVLAMFYYDYYAGDETLEMTAAEFLSFISDTVMNDETFSEYIDDEMKENVEMLDKFADAETLTKPMNAEKLADFFDMEAENIKDLFLLYYIEEGGVSTGSMTLTTFADFVTNEVAKDPDYKSMFDASTLSKMEQLATFTDAKKMTTPYTYKDIASLLDMDADSVKLLFVYYYAMLDSYNPGTMTFPEFVDFLQNDIANDPTFSSYLDESTMDQIEMLASFTDKTALQTQRSTTELSSLLGIDESLVKTIFVLHNAQDVSDNTMTLAQFTGFLTNNLLNDPMFGSSFDEATKTQLQTMNKLIQLAASNQGLATAQMAQMVGMDEATISQLYFMYYSGKEDFQQEVAAMTMTLQDFLTLLKANSTQEQQAQLAQMEQLITIAVSGQELNAATMAEITGMNPDAVSAVFVNQNPAVDVMTLPAFLNAALQLSPENTQLQQINQIVQLAVSGTSLNAQTVAKMFGVQESQVQQLFGLTLASQKTISLSNFTSFLVSDVLSNAVYANNFTEEQKAQLTTMNQMVQLAASGTRLDAQTLAQTFGMEKDLIEIVFRLYFGSDILGKTMSLEETVNFILADSVMNSYMDSERISQLQMMQKIIKASVNGTEFVYNELADLLGMDSSMLKMLYTVHASEKQINKWSLSMHTIINFLLNNSDILESMMGSSEISSLSTAQAIINGSVNGTSYTANQISKLMGMSKEQAQQLYLLYISRHGDTSGWTLSVKDFIDFIIDDVLSNSEYADKIDADTSDMLSSARTMVNAVISGEVYTAEEMGTLLSGLSEELESSMVELMYLYAESSPNANPEWTMTIEELFNYLVDVVLVDERFCDLLDEDAKVALSEAQVTLEDGKKQLVTEQHSRMIITTSYPPESEKTYAFISALSSLCDDKLTGDYYFVGNSAMNYEMSQTFDEELLFITVLTAVVIYLIVAISSKSFIIPLILVLIVQTGVYITVSTIGLQGNTIYYLALLIVQCILMGATIDYGILFTNYYVENRKTENVLEALKKAYAGAIHTISTSGLILVIVTAIVGNGFKEPTVAAIVKTLSIGSFVAIVLILFILPGVLACCDKLITKKNNRA